MKEKKPVKKDKAGAKVKAKIKVKAEAKVEVGGPREASFFEDVWDVVRQIPRGRVTSYGAIAAYLGTKLSARMVGWAMNAAHGQPDVPAQRVLNRNGMLTGKAHFGGDRMQKLLEKDGVKVEDDTVVDFKTRFWDPAIELGL